MTDETGCFPAYCCPRCGACVGYVGRAFMALLGKYAPHGFIEPCKPLPPPPAPKEKA